VHYWQAWLLRGVGSLLHDLSRGLGTAAPRALSTAMIRDRYEGSAMAQLMSRMVAVFLLVPILAPSIGAGLINIAPWRIVFWVPAGVALILMIWIASASRNVGP